MDRPNLVTVTTHYRVDDEECMGDYWHVSIQFDGVEVIRYADQYNDKGYEKADGFTDALLILDPTLTIEYCEAADAERD